MEEGARRWRSRRRHEDGDATAERRRRATVATPAQMRRKEEDRAEEEGWSIWKKQVGDDYNILMGITGRESSNIGRRHKNVISR